MVRPARGPGGAQINQLALKVLSQTLQDAQLHVPLLYDCLQLHDFLLKSVVFASQQGKALLGRRRGETYVAGTVPAGRRDSNRCRYRRGRYSRLGLADQRIQFYLFLAFGTQPAQGQQPRQVRTVAPAFPVLDRRLGSIEGPRQRLLAQAQLLPHAADNLRGVPDRDYLASPRVVNLGAANVG